MSSEPVSEPALAAPALTKIKILDSKQAYVRAMNANGLTVIEGTGSATPRCSSSNVQLIGNSIMVRTVQSHRTRGLQACR